MKATICFMLMALIAGSSARVFAQPDCELVFSDAAQTHKNGGLLEIKNDAKIIDSPDNILDTTNLSASSLSCVAVTCSASGSAAASSNYSNFPGGATLDITSDQILAPGNYEELRLDEGVVLTIGEGDYTFKNGFEVKKNAVILVSGSGTARIFVNGDAIFREDSALNVASNEDRVFIFSNKKFTLEKRVNIIGVLYANKQFIAKEDAQITGSVSGEKVTLEQRVTVTYDATLRDTTDLNGFCNQPPRAFIDIVVAANASTCVPHDVTIRVCTDISCSSLNTGYTGTVDLQTSTSHGDWSESLASGILISGAADSGMATFEFEPGNAGTATLQLANTRAESLEITATDTLDASNTDTSGSVSYSDNAFVIEDIDSLGEGPAGADVAVAGRNHRYRVQFVQRDNSQLPANCAVASSYNSPNQALKAWIQRSAELNTATGPAIGATVLPEAQPAAGNIVLDFSSGGIATFDLVTSDVGQYRIHLLDDSRLYANNTDVLGISNQLTVRPFGFDIDIEIAGVEDRASNGTAGASYASDSSGSVFATAGGAFTVELTAVQWQAADDADNDGQPDASANLSNNPATQSFGSENAPEQAALSSSLVAPAGGLAGVLSGTLFSGFSSGQALRGDVSWSEVGILQLNARLADSNYLASGSNVNGVLGSVGRFVPDSFALSAAVVNEACAAGGFSYMGEVLSVAYNLIAQNVAGGTTQNYRGSFIKLDATQGSLGYGGYASASATNLSARLQPDAATFNAATAFIWGPAGGLGFGTGELNTRLILSRAAAPDGEHITTLGALVSDADNVTNAPLNLDVNGGGNDYTSVGTTRQRYGRVFMENAFGPETRELAVPFIAEYFSSALAPSGGFVPNSADSCSMYALGDFSEVPGSYTLNLDAADTAPAAISGTSYAAGRGSVTLSAPGAGNDGSVDVEFTVPAYLRFDWDSNSATVDTSPVNTATFGSFRGNDRIIYRREVLQ